MQDRAEIVDIQVRYTSAGRDDRSQLPTTHHLASAFKWVRRHSSRPSSRQLGHKNCHDSGPSCLEVFRPSSVIGRPFSSQPCSHVPHSAQHSGTPSVAHNSLFGVAALVVAKRMLINIALRPIFGEKEGPRTARRQWHSMMEPPVDVKIRYAYIVFPLNSFSVWLQNKALYHLVSVETTI